MDASNRHPRRGEQAAPRLWSPSDPDTDRVLSPPGKVLPVIGAGISTGAGAPSGEALVKHLLAKYAPSIHGYNAADPRAVATNIVAQRRATREEVHREVAALCAPEAWTLTLTPALEAIARCASGWVVTLSYDPAVELAAEHLGRPCRPFTWQDPWPLQEALDDHELLKVFYLHGRYDEVGGLVLDEEDYRRIEHRSVQVYLGGILQRYNGCFLGTEFDELHLVPLLRDLPVNQPAYVFFFRDRPKAQRDWERRLKIERPTAIVETFVVENRDWSRLDYICERYLVEKEEPEPVPHFRFDSPTGLYVPQQLVPASVAESRSDLGLTWSLELGHIQAVAETELAVKARTLIVGPPGSGKTTLLLRAAQQVPADERAVFVRLGTVGDPLGDPEAVLLDWARQAQEPGSAPVQREDLGRHRFHFLLDGLDEVPSARQTKLAERIIDIADALPQHRYTVTSRPVPANRAFAERDWEHLELASTYEWRNAYLAKADVSWDELRERVAALGDLDELLRLPAFLSQLVDAYKENRLPDHGDLLAVTQAFIEVALSDPVLDPVREAVRPWLQDVAFAMQLAGRTELTREELEQVALPAGLNLGPDEDVVDLLARRSLLDAREHVRFVHRLIAETLVAEKLLALGPEHPELLDTVAPLTDHARGLRSDWMVPVTLAAGRDPSWRAALRERDSLAAARTVLPNADIHERRDAALTLWRSYLRTRVWMHNRNALQLLQDSEAMGRLLRHGDLPDVVDEVLGGIHHESPQVRSNAMEVLADAGLNDLLAPLVRAALAGDPEPVVRRQAASAARQQRLTAAYPLVCQRALTTTDKFEEQDMVAVALRLAPDDELIDLAVALLRARRSRHFRIEHLVGERFGATGRLAVMRAQAEEGELSHSASRDLYKLLPELPGDEAVTEDVAFVAAAARAYAEPVRDRLAAHPDVTLRGLIAAVESGAAYPYAPHPLMSGITVQQLQAAPFGDEELQARFVEAKEREEQAAAMRASAEPAHVGALDDDADDPEHEEPPTLAELLARPPVESDDLLMQNCIYFASQVDDLDARERRKLATRVKRWWPEKGITASFHGNRVEWEAHASLAYGSYLKPKLSPVQWAEVAAAPLPYAQRDEWLKARYTRKGALHAAETWTTGNAEMWSTLVEAIPTKLPLPVVRALAERVREGDSYVDNIAARLASERRASALRKLAKVSPSFHETMSYHLARLGDRQAQRKRLDALLQRFGTETTIHSDDLGWMLGITDVRLLPRLFEALLGSYEHPNPDGWNDTMGPISEAIRRADGPDALARYDEILSADPPPFPGAQFLRYQRDAIADDMLRRAGDLRRAALAARSGVPLMQEREPPSA